jgi:hypothetical protein
MVLGRTLDASHTTTPQVINGDRDPVYPKVVDELKAVSAAPSLIPMVLPRAMLNVAFRIQYPPDQSLALVSQH